MAKSSSTVITLPQMVDLALNSPEIGIVNFTVLHSLLHVIVQQLELSECSVEFRGSDSERLQNYISSAKPGPIITLTEYTVGPEGTEKLSKKRPSKKTKADEKGQADAAQTEKAVAASTSLQTVVVVEQNAKVTDKPSSPHFSVAITQDHYDHLLGDIEELQVKVKELSELPANIGLVEALRAAGKDKPSPVLDMFHILTLNKRMDAAEQGMEKVGTMLEDLAREQKGEGPLVAHVATGVNIEGLGEIDNRVKALENALANGEFGQPVAPKTSADAIPTDVTVSAAESDAPSIIRQSIGSGIDLIGINFAETPIPEAMAMIQTELQRLRKICGNEFLQTVKDLEILKEALQSKAAPPEVRIGQIELQLNTVLEQISSLDTMYNNQMALLNDKLDHFKDELMSMGDKVAPGSATSDQVEVEMFNKVNVMSDELRALQETAEKLWEEREGRQHLLDMIQENIEILKNVKSDKEEVEEALAEKADTCVVNRKVSHDLFDEVRENLNKLIDEIFVKLTEQEETLINHVAILTEEINKKLDATELEQMKEYTNNKLKLLGDKITALAQMKDDTEAAGTKSKFLRNVNCISCDTKAIMRKEIDASLLPRKPGMPAGKSIGPYLAYELDQMRKQEKCIGTKNKQKLLEQALQTGRVDKLSDNLCNRYCGGSHTTTTPTQRVTRIGHFLEQWGPEISPVVDETIRGSDGKMYRGRDDEKLKQLTGKTKEKPVEAVPETKEEKSLMTNLTQMVRRASEEDAEMIDTKGMAPSTMHQIDSKPASRKVSSASVTEGDKKKSKESIKRSSSAHAEKSHESMKKAPSKTSRASKTSTGKPQETIPEESPAPAEQAQPSEETPAAEAKTSGENRASTVQENQPAAEGTEPAPEAAVEPAPEAAPEAPAEAAAEAE